MPQRALGERAIFLHGFSGVLRGLAVAPLLLGLSLGLRHALEPDHLAAVSTLADARQPRAAMWVGVWWGVGHALALTVVAGGLAFAERLMPAGLEVSLELAVGVMVTGLGGRALWQSFKEGQAGTAAPHAHGPHRHTHSGLSPHVHVGSTALSLRPLLVGLVHGTAGSGALAAAAMSHAPHFAARLLSIGTFGVGSIIGMAALTALAGSGLARLSARDSIVCWLNRAGAVISIVVGSWWGLTAAAHLVA